MHEARAGHTATLLLNGKVLVLGGLGVDPYPHNVLDTAELYDPSTGTWSVTGRLIASKSGHSATLLPDGKVLVVGQATTAMESAELYDPGTGIWSLASSPSGIWRDHTATLLKNWQGPDRRRMASGYGNYVRALLYEPATNTWSDTGDMSIARGGEHRATLLRDGRVSGHGWMERCGRILWSVWSRDI
jgi:hypothetical protein